MKKILAFFVVALTSALTLAQSNQVIWNNGRAQHAQPITNVDSITFPDQILEGDTMLIILPRSVKQIVHDTVYVVKHDTVYVSVNLKEGGFSVSKSTQVQFSSGNLQYQPSTSTWRFAENQYDFIGSDNANISNASYTGWLDLFGWGTGDDPTKCSTSKDDYTTFTDWGTNVIGSDPANTWRTLSKTEWQYLISTRTNAKKLNGGATVNNVTGWIILPDIWTTPDGLTFNPSAEKGLVENPNRPGYYTNSQENNFSHNVYSADEWAKMEAAGAIFLPVAGMRSGTSLENVDEGAYMSSEMPSEWEYVYGGIIFSNLGLYTNGGAMARWGISVRLVKNM